jgi:hypothetical protein
MPVDDRREFTVDGADYAVRIPKVQDIKEANELRSRTFNESLQRGDLLRDQLESELRKRELWNDDREMEYQTLRREVLDGEYSLEKGGIKLSQAKRIAEDMKDKREKMISLLSSRTDLDANTAEGKADAARFNYLFSCCLVYDETDEAYFPNKLDDYLLNQEDPVAIAGATEFYYLITGGDTLDEQLPENLFLKKFKFVDSDYRPIDKAGRLLDNEGRHVDAEGYFVKWRKNGISVRVDANGRPVNDDGNFDVEHSPFLDDTGSPIDESGYEEAEEEVEEIAEEKPKPAKKRKKATKAKPKKKVVSEDEEEAPEETPETEAEEAEEVEEETVDVS